MNKAVLAACASIGAIAVWQPALAADDNRIDIQAVATETYDSNVARSDSFVAAERDIIPADSIFEPSLAIDLLLPVSRQALFLKGSVGYDFYANNHQLDNGRVDLQGGVHGQVARCKGTLSGDLGYSQTDLQYLSTVATRNAESDETIGLDGSCGGQIGFVPTLAVSERWSQNSASALFTSDYTDFSLKPGLAYRQPLFGELTTYFSYDQTDFPNRDLLMGPGYKAYGVGVQYDRHIGAKIEGTVRVAYTSVRPDVATVAGYQGVTYGADLSFHFSRLLQAKLTVERAIQPTIQPDVTYELENTYGLEADYTLSRKLKFMASISAQSNRYSGVLDPRVDIASENDWGVNGSIDYQLNRRFGLSLQAGHEVRDANLTIFSYSDNRVGLSLKAAI